MERKKPTPVHIITGFLGAGKTTFLNQFIRARLPERIMVIENEVGDVNIDSSLVLSDVGAVIEMTAGCICCSLNDELYDVLHTLSTQKDTFDRLVIETTGVADPDAVVEVFLRNRAVEEEFELQNVICLADARHLVETLEDSETARRQVLAADVVLLNKIDLLDDAENAEKLLEILRGINPLAHTYTGTHGAFPIDEIIAFDTIYDTGAEAQTQSVKQKHAHRHEDITTFCLTFEDEFKLSELSYELSRLLALYRHQIYRVKGIVAYDNEPTKAIVQSVRNVVTLSDGVAWKPNEVRQSKIVFIGKGVGREAIERIFTRCLIKPVPVKLTAQNSLLRRPIFSKPDLDTFKK